MLTSHALACSRMAATAFLIVRASSVNTSRAVAALSRFEPKVAPLVFTGFIACSRAADSGAS